MIDRVNQTEAIKHRPEMARALAGMAQVLEPEVAARVAMMTGAKAVTVKMVMTAETMMTSFPTKVGQ
jgi:hypothetical protein